MDQQIALANDIAGALVDVVEDFNIYLVPAEMCMYDSGDKARMESALKMQAMYDKILRLAYHLQDITKC